MARTLERLLPPSPARVLDAGAGTGFLTLLAARLGHRVTALDLSPQMLDKLRHKAAAEGLDVEAVEAPSHQPPGGDFDAIIERHLIWTLPDPPRHAGAAASGGANRRLVLFESAWGRAADPGEALRARARKIILGYGSKGISSMGRFW